MAIPSLLVPFNATFDPNPDEGYQFTFTTNTLQGPVISLNNAFFVPDEGGIVSITLTNATFADPPIVWSIAPTTVTVVTKTSDSTISFVVPAPDRYFRPWVFRIIADADGVNAIRSQNIYLVKDFALENFNFTLKYSAKNGNFSLLDSSTASFQDGLILENTLALINTVVPTTDAPQFHFTVSLETEDPFEGVPLPTFSFAPVVWGTAPTSPDWIRAVPVVFLPPPPPILPQTVQFTLLPEAVGQSASLQFSIQVTNPDGESITVLSPDPIIMNATIGDG